MTKSKDVYHSAKDFVDQSTGEVLRFFNGRPHLRPTVDASKDGRTKSEFAKSCDLKERIRVYQERGILPGGRTPPGREQYIDTTVLPDSYHAALNLVAKVTSHFAALPSDVRTKFHNDPQLYLADLEKKAADKAKAKADRDKAVSEAQQYDLEDKLSSGRSKAQAREKRVQEALKEPVDPPKKEG